MNKVLLAAAVAVVSCMSVDARGLRDKVRAESRQDSARHAHTPPNPENLPGTPSEADVGDADSFGRAVKFLGFAQSEFAAVLPDCEGQVPGTCITQTDPTTGVTLTYFGDGAVVRLPPRAAKSLLCFSLTAQGAILYSNNSGAPLHVAGTLGAQWRIESEVLNDPALIDSATGLPFNGVISSGTGLEQFSRITLPGESQSISPTTTRSCISGHLSRRSLIGQGLTEAQAREVFRKPITIRFGSLVNGLNAQVIGGFGVRIYGD